MSTTLQEPVETLATAVEQRAAVADVVNQIVEDSTVSPRQYLHETSVPFGGE